MSFKTVAQTLSPRALWLPGDGMTDESGNGHTATNNGGTASGTGGPGTGLASYMSFDGVADYLDLTTVGTFAQNLGTATIVVWVRTSATAGGSILGTFSDGGTSTMLVQANFNAAESNDPGRVRWATVAGGVFCRLGTNSFFTVNNGNWHMLVIRAATTTASPTATVRVDDITSTLSNTIFAQQSTFASFQYVLTAGCRNVRGVLDQFLACDIAGIALFDSNLTDGQARALYNATTGEPRGAWSWWTRPRAVEFKDTLYMGVAGQNGEIVIDEYTAADGYTVSHELRQGTLDDHDNGSILIKASNPPIVFYSEHSGAALRYRIGTQNIESGLALGAEQTIAGTNVTYSEVHESGGDIWVIYRAAVNATTWWFIKSTDWGANWSTPQELFDHSDAMYLATTQRAGVVRCAMSRHPTNSAGTQTVYYAEINLSTGAITQADGTSLGNLDGTNLPIDITTCGVVATATNVQWVYDVSDGPNPEIAWVDFDAAAPGTTGAYKYSVWNGTSWTTNDVAPCGEYFVTAVSEEYLGGAQFPPSTTGGKILVSREDAGTWYVEEYTTADSGANWSADEVYSGATPVVRTWYTVGDDSVTGVDIVGNKILDYDNYTDFDATMVLLEAAAAPTVHELTPAVAAVAAQPVTPTPTALAVQLSPASIAATAQALTPVVSEPPVVVNLAPATLIAQPSTLDATLAPYSTTLTPSTITSTASALDEVPAGLSVQLSPATATTSSSELSPVVSDAPVSVELTPANLSLAASPISPVIAGAPVVVDLAVAELTLQPIVLTPSPDGLAVTLSPSTLTSSANALSSTLSPFSTELTPSTLTLDASILEIVGPDPILPVEISAQRTYESAGRSYNPPTGRTYR